MKFEKFPTQKILTGLAIIAGAFAVTNYAEGCNDVDQEALRALHTDSPVFLDGSYLELLPKDQNGNDKVLEVFCRGAKLAGYPHLQKKVYTTDGKDILRTKSSPVYLNHPSCVDGQITDIDSEYFPTNTDDIKY